MCVWGEGGLGWAYSVCDYHLAIGLPLTHPILLLDPSQGEKPGLCDIIPTAMETNSCCCPCYWFHRVV